MWPRSDLANPEALASMKKLAVFALPALGVAAAAWLVTTGGPAPVARADAPVELSTARAERMRLGDRITATGVIRPRVGAQVAVGSRVSGVLQRLHVTVGERVARGEMLAEIDPTEFEARLAIAEAELESALVDRDFASRQLDRARGLLASDVISQVEFDEAERAFRSADARVRQAEAGRRSAEIQLGYTEIRAPISGVVASVTTQVGETVAASFAAPTFVTIIDLDRLEVWAYVDETDIGRVEPGQRATFTVDTYVGEPFEAVVTAIQPQAEIQNNVVNYITLLDIGDPRGFTLRPEMTTSVSIDLDGAAEALAVPNAALRRDGGSAYVLVPGDEGPIRRDVRTGRRGRTHTEIADGLAEGDSVLIGDVEEEEAGR